MLPSLEGAENTKTEYLSVAWTNCVRTQEQSRTGFDPESSNADTWYFVVIHGRRPHTCEIVFGADDESS